MLDKSTRVQLRIPPDILDELDRMAAAHGLNRSAMVRLLVRQASRDGAGTTTRPIEDH